MKIEIKKDHPLTLAVFLGAVFLVGPLMAAGQMEDARLAREDLRILVGVAVLLFVWLAYRSQIEQAVVVEDGKIIVRKKKETIELVLADVVSASIKNRLLELVLENGRCSFDLSFFNRADRKAVVAAIEDEKARAARGQGRSAEALTLT